MMHEYQSPVFTMNMKRIRYAFHSLAINSRGEWVVNYETEFIGHNGDCVLLQRSFVVIDIDPDSDKFFKPLLSIDRQPDIDDVRYALRLIFIVNGTTEPTADMIDNAFDCIASIDNR